MVPQTRKVNSIPLLELIRLNWSFDLIYFQGTLYFAKEHFKTAVPVAITSLLVMYTLKGSISSKLPPTSYIKFIDIWLLYGLLLPFFIIILLILIEHLPDNSNVICIKLPEVEAREKKKPYKWFSIVKTTGCVYLPCFQLSFLIIYSYLAFVRYNEQ